VSFNQLKTKAEEYLPPEKLALLESAYNFAEKAHEGQLRISGESYLEHPIQTAIPLSDIETNFGAEIAKLVDGVTKLSKLSLSGDNAFTSTSEQQTENLRKMLVAMAEDIRVVFIKLADRLHNMRTLDVLPLEKQHRIARETLEIYAPLSHRLGIWELKWQMEDLSFRYLEPEKYRKVARLIAARRAQRESVIAQVIQIMGAEFGRIDLKAEISGRPKHIYSIHQKIERYAALGKNFDDIHDLLAILASFTR